MVFQVQNLSRSNQSKTKRTPTTRKKIILNRKRKARIQSDKRSIERDGKSEEDIFEKQDRTEVIRCISS